MTERGNINREIIKNNMLLEQAKEILMLAKQEVHSAQYAKIKNAAVSVKNEVIEMIAKMRELQNESQQHNRQQNKTKRREKEI